MELTFYYMFIGFFISLYSVIGNDSIQTLGTFLSSNRKIDWRILASAASLIMIVTLSYGYYVNNGDLAFGRLDSIPYDLSGISIFVVIAPIILYLLTRWGFPVSTTFFILSLFAMKSTIEQMILKSLLGYVIAFISAYLVWIFINRFLTDYFGNEIKSKGVRQFWVVAQWFATGYLWSVWIMHDFANIVVFLPRNMSLMYLALVLVATTFVIFYIFSQKGGKIQKIVDNKTGTVLIQNATIIDIIFASVLFYFKEVNSIPMSTTWVFIGLLAGREIAIHHSLQEDKRKKKVYPMVIRDFSKVMLGLVISVFMAFLIGNL